MDNYGITCECSMQHSSLAQRAVCSDTKFISHWPPQYSPLRPPPRFRSKWSDLAIAAWHNLQDSDSESVVLKPLDVKGLERLCRAESRQTGVSKWQVLPEMSCQRKLVSATAKTLPAVPPLEHFREEYVAGSKNTEHLKSASSRQGKRCEKQAWGL